VRFLPYADHITVLEKGTVTEQGSFTSLSIAKDVKCPEEDDTVEDVGSSDEELEVLKMKFTPHELKTKTVKEDKSRQLGDWEIYRYYFAAVSWFVVAVFFGLQLLWAFLSCFPNVWLKWWTDANNRHPNGRNGYYIGIYAAFQMAGLISSGSVTW
jgi:ATP-binding cassette subfamily C (CFTR/MRP) protein 1